MKICSFDSGYLINDKFLFSAQNVDIKKINLFADLGEDILQREDSNVIDFPGEYDIKGTFFKVIVGKDNKLNYLVKTKEVTFAIIQTPAVLERDDVNDMDFWLFTDQRVESKIDQLELEWDKIFLDGSEIDLSFDKSVNNEASEVLEVE